MMRSNQVLVIEPLWMNEAFDLRLAFPSYDMGKISFDQYDVTEKRIIQIRIIQNSF